MSVGELSFESPPSLSVTWSTSDFFRLAAESDYSLRSPDFTFAGRRYSVGLFRIPNSTYDPIGIELLNWTDADPVALYDVWLKMSTVDIPASPQNDYEAIFFFFNRGAMERDREAYAPGGTLTVFFSVRRLTKPSSAGRPESGGARTRVIPERRGNSGDLSFQSFPFLYVTWRIPGFFRLSLASRLILESPEFPFSDGRCRLRLHKAGSYYPFVDFQLVNLTDTDVSWEFGLKSTTGEEIYTYISGTLPRRRLYMFEQELDSAKFECSPDGHLTVFCCVRSREPNKAGNPRAESHVFPGSKAATHPESVADQISNE